MTHSKSLYKKYKYKKIAFITGGNRGIGKEILNKLAHSTYITISTTTTKINTKKFNSYVQKKNINNIIILTLNLNDTTSINHITKFIIKKISSPSIIINNAGIISDRLLINMNYENWYKVINVNLNANYFIIKNFLVDMIKFKWGRIVNISSIIAYTGNSGQTNYSASKAGLVGFSKSLARETAKKGITVNIVSPGFIKTNMTKNLTTNHTAKIKSIIPLNKLGKPKDIARVVIFLISNKASYITGETINVNGGLIMN